MAGPTYLKIVHFQPDPNTWKLICDGSQRWFATPWDLRDDRIYSLAFGRRDKDGVWHSDVDDIVFDNGHDGRQIVFKVRQIHFTPWSAGWGFIEFEPPIESDGYPAW